MRDKCQNASVCVLQQVPADQVFIIACADGLFQGCEYRNLAYLGEGIFVTVDPVADQVQSINQALGIRGKVRFSVPEFQVVDAGPDRLLIHSVFDRLGQHLADQGGKGFFFVGIRALGNDGEIRLAQAVLKGAVDIAADAGFHEGLFEGSSRRAQQRVVQDLKGGAELCVAVCSDHHVVGQIGVLLLWLIFRHGVNILILADRGEGLLERHGRIDLQRFKGREVFPVDEVQFFGHVHVSVQVDVAVGRMIIGPVEVQEGFISQLRDMGRISA